MLLCRLLRPRDRSDRMKVARSKNMEPSPVPAQAAVSQWAFGFCVLCFVLGIDGRWADVLPLCLGDTSPESPGGSVIPLLRPSC